MVRSRNNAVKCPLTECGRIFENGNSRADNQYGMENHYQVLTHILQQIINLLISSFRTTSCPAANAANSSKTSMPIYLHSEGRLNSMRCPSSVRQMLSAPIQTVTGDGNSRSLLLLTVHPNRIFNYFNNKKANQNSMEQHRQVVEFVGLLQHKHIMLITGA